MPTDGAQILSVSPGQAAIDANKETSYARSNASPPDNVKVLIFGFNNTTVLNSGILATVLVGNLPPGSAQQLSITGIVGSDVTGHGVAMGDSTAIVTQANATATRESGQTSAQSTFAVPLLGSHTLIKTMREAAVRPESSTTLIWKALIHSLSIPAIEAVQKWADTQVDPQALKN